LGQLYVGPNSVGNICHRYSAINLLFSVFAGMHQFLLSLPHPYLHAEIVIAFCYRTDAPNLEQTVALNSFYPQAITLLNSSPNTVPSVFTPLDFFPPKLLQNLTKMYVFI
jgi:hypothetical protein